MILRVGKILRFHGPNAESEIETAASELRGGCRRDGNNLVITRPKKMLFIDHFNGAHLPPVIFERRPNES